MTLVQKEVKRITMRPNWSEVQIRPAIPSNALYFEANAANAQIALAKQGTPFAVNIETSTDGTNWSDYTFWTNITLTNIGDKIYFRNKSETVTNFSTSTASYYHFGISWSVSAYGDVGYLLCKNSTDTLAWHTYAFCRLFYNTTNLKRPPSLPATTLSDGCYYQMFRWCQTMTWIPKLPALTLPDVCYCQTFYSCRSLKLSETSTGSYTQAYRIPTTWTWTTSSSNWNSNMFYDTWWTFWSAPTIDTTYYVHTDNTIVW